MIGSLAQSEPAIRGLGGVCDCRSFKLSKDGHSRIGRNNCDSISRLYPGLQQAVCEVLYTLGPVEWVRTYSQRVKILSRDRPKSKRIEDRMRYIGMRESKFIWINFSRSQKEFKRILGKMTS